MYSSNIIDRLYKYMEPYRAVNVITPKASVLGVEEIDVRHSLYRILASDIKAPNPRPWSDLSHVDGFAVRSSDTRNASSKNPIALKLVEDIDPRNAHEYTLKPGETVFVETGYPIPDGADAVYPIESTRIAGDKVLFFKPIKSGENVIPRGSDVEEGMIVAKKGTRITPMLQKLLIDLGIPLVKVYEKPRIAILPTGDEIVDEVVPVSTTKIPMSSAYLVKSILEYWGCNVTEITKASDDPRDIIEKTSTLMDKNHIVVSIGGVSMGPRDYTWTSLYKHFKPSSVFRGIKAHPGRSTSGMLVNNKSIVNLPGLPQSTLSGLVFILIPLIHRLYGVEFKLPYINAITKNTVYLKSYPSFYRLRLVDLDYDSMEAVIHSKIESYHVYPLVTADGFTVIPPGIDKIKEKTMLKVYFFEPLFTYKKMDQLVLF